MCMNERQWLREKNNLQKQRLKSVLISKRKEFDKAVRKAKRKFKKTNDDYLIEFQTKDQHEFWKKLGLLGLRLKDNHSYLCR